MSIEFKRHQAEAILERGWYSWEREHRSGDDKPVEVLVGGTASNFLRYIRFEREALHEDQGHRQLLAEQVSVPSSPLILPTTLITASGSAPTGSRLHALAREFEMDESQVLDLIASARRLKMAVRGWVAEEHLVRLLQQVDGVEECMRNDEEGAPDVQLRYRGSRVLHVECKNVLRKTASGNIPRVDFQRTRASKSDPCSRYYAPEDFDVIAACLHAVTERWEFRYVLPTHLETHERCPGKLANNVRVDGRWQAAIENVLRQVA